MIRQVQVNSGELTQAQALELAVQEGDVPGRFLDSSIDIVEERIGTIVKAISDAQEAYDQVEALIRRKKL